MTTRDGQVATPASGSSAPLWDNPLGTDGFEFVEYTAPDTSELHRLFEVMGFSRVARHRSKDVSLYRQGNINFVVNAEPNSLAQQFARDHGPNFLFGAGTVFKEVMRGDNQICRPARVVDAAHMNAVHRR